MNTGTPSKEEARPSEPTVNSNQIVRQPLWWAYVLAVVSTSATMILLLSLDAWTPNRPTLILFVIPIILSAYVGGAGPGWGWLFLLLGWLLVCGLGVFCGFFFLVFFFFFFFFFFRGRRTSSPI